MNYWTYVSLGIFGIGLLMLFIVDRIVQTVWNVYKKPKHIQKYLIDGITR